MKINVPKGTPILNCNVKYDNKRPIMPSEIILAPSKWEVTDIDNGLNIIELSPAAKK